jgi:thioredoxin 1
MIVYDKGASRVSKRGLCMMISRRYFLYGSVVAATLASATPAYAGPVQAFDQARFNALRASGAPILVFVAADWCPTCRVQGPIIGRLGAEAGFAPLNIFRLDFDKQKVERRALRASRQATIIAYRGQAEVARSVGETAEAQIRATMRAAAS